ncbi:phenylalanine--tRNA ligase subunit alpha [Sugiyamaella lignohabitans]|uniref:Phenylalanine--tRNA ligase alpha subunit n=1 Tax=Sugiyamaella lignohabitans TaxID=796027 RepID=A0A167DPQ1_9ASCO|nr:phenylalanine--tRNA ligase subunit alpha [Sugiyamaella lignohabitans]ANB13145.1 phenylalanine--tRNA ligase subunit alpha [Sugiyamaella lignohabitans]
MSDFALTVLATLNKGPVTDSRETFPGIDSQVVQGAVTSLAARNMVTFKQIEKELWAPTAEGEDIIANGSHEIRLYDEVIKSLEGLKIADVAKVLGPSGKVGQQRAFKNGWVKKDGDKLVKGVDEAPVDVTKDQLTTIKSTGTLDDAKELNELKKRKLVTKTKLVSYSIEKGPEFALEIKKLDTDLTIEMLQSGTWKTSEFKPYNFSAEGINTNGGAFHPLNKVREEFRQIFFSMGFTEMPTNQYVESGFWNFDTLYVPQQHPARDLQDTFYLKDPVKALEPEDKTYWSHVRKVHEEGEFGSIGYRYPWKPEEATKLVLRTHTTSVSAAMLHKLAKNPGPARYFSIDKVFRNEAVDATHLAEFHQVEGVIADYNLTLGDLIGFMERYFSKMGVNQIRFKPAYNPYTEPSMEIFGYHEGLGKWVEVGNSGMFRPEMLESMGLPKDLRVHGFGLSLERPTMIKYAVSNIRELLGHKVSLDFIENNPAVRFEEALV